MKNYKIVFIAIGVIFFSIISNAQNLIKKDAPKIYIDCHCDRDYIKEQIPIVNYVIDRNDADIHALFTDQRTGSGGREFSILLVGRNIFNGINDTIKYFTNQIDTEDQRRTKMVEALKAGLAKYLFRSKIADQMKIVYTNGTENLKDPQSTTEDWDYWVFRTSINTALNGQQTTRTKNIGASISANRVTEENKIGFWISTDYNHNEYDYDDETIVSITKRNNFSTHYIGAIDDNWSWGVEAAANQSSYSNIKLGLSCSAGVEYNIFPYSEANQRQFRIEYQINSIYNNYTEETIYLVTKESLLRHSIKISLELIETWGNAGFQLSGSNYFHDFNLYSLSSNAFLSLRLVKGLALDVRGRYSKINNQLALPRGEASLEDVLLRRKEIATQYTYEFRVGLSYSFGSIYNNAINPRFDD